MSTLHNTRTGETLRVLDARPDLLRMEFHLDPGAAIPGTHLHPRSEQRVHVTEGELHLRIAGHHCVVGAGDSASVPAGTPHFQWNPGHRTVRAVEEYRPAGDLYAMFATFFRLASEGMLTRRGRVASPLLVAAFFAEFRGEVRATPRPLQWVLDALAPVAAGLGYRRRVAACRAEVAHG